MILLIASFFFYGFWNYKFLSLLVISTLIDYFAAIKIESSSPENKKRYLLLSLFSNLGILGIFKYYNFFAMELSHVLSLFLNEPISQFHLNIILPMGISFYTFQSMSYTIDVYRGIIKTTRSIIDFSLYVSFFPQLVAGPIEKAKDLIPQLKEISFGTKNDWIVAAHLITLGYFKKVIIGDQLSPMVDETFHNYMNLSSLKLLEGIIAFSLQIYFDFSGYSDIARGLGRIFGVHLGVNFKQPYLASSITEFWHRWHISLSQWLKEYLYFSLGGNRKSEMRTKINLLLTMLLGGLWHGANTTFIVWGGLHGLLLVIHKIILKTKGNKPQGFFFKLTGIIFTYSMVLVSWIFFRAKNCHEAFAYLKKILSFTGPFDLSIFLSISFMLIGMFILDLMSEKSKHESPLMYLPKVSQWFLILLINLIAFILIATSDKNAPFIYFQF